MPSGRQRPLTVGCLVLSRARTVITLTLAMAVSFCLVLVAPASANAAPGLAVSRTSAIAGETVTITGKTGQKVKRPVVLQRHNGKKWIKVRKTMSTSKGAYTFTYKVPGASGAKTTLRVLVPKRSAHGKKYRQRTTGRRTITTVAQSGSLTVPANGALGITVTAISVFTPARPGRSTRLERFDGTRWYPIATSTQGRNGTSNFRFVPRAAGPAQLRAVSSASRGAAASTSGSATITVTAPSSPVEPPVDPPEEPEPPVDPPVDPPEEPEPTWTLAATNTFTTDYATAVDLPDGRVLISGGRPTDTDTPTARTRIFDPTTVTFADVPNAPTARVLATGVVLSDGRVAIFGGRATPDTTSPVLNTVDYYDPVLNVWATTARPELNVSYEERELAVALDDGRVLVLPSAAEGPRTMFVFDPADNTWTDASASTDPLRLGENRAVASLTKLADGRVLLAGGIGKTAGFLKSAEIYNPVAGTWSKAADLPGERYFQGAILTSNGDILLRGGGRIDLDGPDSYPADRYSPTVSYLYRPSTDTWREISSDQVLEGPQLLKLPDGTVMTSGGWTVPESDRVQVTILNTVTGGSNGFNPVPVVLEELHLVARPDGVVLALSPGQSPVFLFQ